MPGVLLRVAYDGSHFRGWSRQAGHRTVEEVLHKALAKIDDHVSIPRGMSRTDSGVHATAQMVGFDARHDIPPRGWVLSVNAHLPDDVAIRAARIVTPGFDPRYASTRKRYRYRLLLDRVRDPMRAPFTWRVGGVLNLERMQREAAVLVGTHDFAAFRAAADLRAVTVRTLTRVELVRSGDDELHVVVEGSAFLYNMVRIIVGTLVDIGLEHRGEGTMARALIECDRTVVGTTAPANGLCLEHAELTLPPESSEPWPL